MAVNKIDKPTTTNSSIDRNLLIFYDNNFVIELGKSNILPLQQLNQFSILVLRKSKFHQNRTLGLN